LILKEERARLVEEGKRLYFEALGKLGLRLSREKNEEDHHYSAR
jgi:hypothetical protein